MKQNRVWVSLYMYVVLIAVVGSSLDAAVYRIDSQAEFDVYKEAIISDHRQSRWYEEGT